MRRLSEFRKNIVKKASYRKLIARQYSSHKKFLDPERPPLKAGDDLINIQKLVAVHHTVWVCRSPKKFGVAPAAHPLGCEAWWN